VFLARNHSLTFTTGSLLFAPLLGESLPLLATSLRGVSQQQIHGSKRSLRSVDVPVRLGGDEFCVLAVDQTAESAEVLAQRVAGEVTRLEAPAVDSPCMPLDIPAVRNASPSARRTRPNRPRGGFVGRRRGLSSSGQRCSFVMP